MKNISVYVPKKYEGSEFDKVSDDIYKTYDDFMKTDSYVTSLSFEQEPEYGEGENPRNISQYPLEDILNQFYVAINDFYEEENEKSDSLCYLEFSGADIKDIKSLLSIVGKHVYHIKNGEYVEMMIE